MSIHPTPFPPGCNWLSRLLARVALWWFHRRRPRLPLRDYEDDLARLEFLSDASNCHCPENVRDKRARQVGDAYRSKAIDRVMRGGGSDGN